MICATDRLARVSGRATRHWDLQNHATYCANRVPDRPTPVSDHLNPVSGRATHHWDLQNHAT
jgi:hypothetical protein